MASWLAQGMMQEAKRLVWHVEGFWDSNRIYGFQQAQTKIWNTKLGANPGPGNCRLSRRNLSTGLVQQAFALRKLASILVREMGCPVLLYHRIRELTKSLGRLAMNPWGSPNRPN